MTEILHGVMFAAAIQTAVGTPNAGIVALTGDTIVVTDGIILGDLESGDDGTGITLPQFVRQSQLLPDRAATFTRRASQFVRVTAEGMAISFVLKGNGATATPSADEAKPLAGIDAIYQGTGLLAATPAAAPEYDYEMNPVTKYLSIRLWSAGMTWVLQDCVVETLTFPLNGGEVGVVTANIRVGSVVTSLFAEKTFPNDVTFGTMETLTPPIVENTDFTWTAARGNGGALGGFGELTIEVANTLEDIPDSNQDSGIRISQSERSINVSGTIWMDDGDTDFEYQQLIDGDVSASMTARLGVAAGATDVINGLNFTLGDIDVTSVNYQKAGAYTQAVIEGNCTSTGTNDEFNLTFD